MPNPIIRTANQRSQSNYTPYQYQTPFDRMKLAFDMIKNSNNPNAAIQQFAMHQPQFPIALQKAQQYLSSFVGNQQNAVETLSKQLGIDLNQLFK